MPGNTRPGLDDILASLEDISTLDDQLEVRFRFGAKGGLAESANDAVQIKALSRRIERNFKETYTKLKSFQASFDVLWMIGTVSKVTFELEF
jgi:restriction endonuclease S subunit